MASAVIDWEGVKHLVLAELEEHKARRSTELLKQTRGQISRCGDQRRRAAPASGAID